MSFFDTTTNSRPTSWSTGRTTTANSLCSIEELEFNPLCPISYEHDEYNYFNAANFDEDFNAANFNITPSLSSENDIEFTSQSLQALSKSSRNLSLTSLKPYFPAVVQPSMVVASSTKEAPVISVSQTSRCIK